MICRPFAIQHSIIVAMSRDLHVWINYNNVTPPPVPNTSQLKLHYYLVGRTRPSIVNFSFKKEKGFKQYFRGGVFGFFLEDGGYLCIFMICTSNFNGKELRIFWAPLSI